jgi:hypothetical protein
MEYKWSRLLKGKFPLSNVILPEKRIQISDGKVNVDEFNKIINDNPVSTFVIDNDRITFLERNIDNEENITMIISYHNAEYFLDYFVIDEEYFICLYEINNLNNFWTLLSNNPIISSFDFDYITSDLIQPFTDYISDDFGKIYEELVDRINLFASED